MQVIGLSKPVYRAHRSIRNVAQWKHGQDIWRSIYYRQDWGQPWQRIAPTISRVRRWCLRKFNNPPTIYRSLKVVELNAPVKV